MEIVREKNLKTTEDNIIENFTLLHLMIKKTTLNY